MMQRTSPHSTGGHSFPAALFIVIAGIIMLTSGGGCGSTGAHQHLIMSSSMLMLKSANELRVRRQTRVACYIVLI